VLIFIFVVSFASSMFFYCQALMSGLGRKRWAMAGLVFGPLLWPMFCMQRRFKVTQRFGWACLIFKA